MIIEVGKTYTVSPKYKKSFVENNFFEVMDDDKKPDFLPRMFTRQIGWRSGSFNITIVNEDEQEVLQEYLDAGDDAGELELTAFEEFEFLESWDGCWEDYFGYDDESTAQLKAAYDKYWSDEALQEEFFNFDSWLEEHFTYDIIDSEYYVVGAIEVELVNEVDVA